MDSIEGTGKFNGKARYGRSKEKRSDCPLVTMGLVMDVQGFPKKSRIYEGNISESKTLEQMIEDLFIGECGGDSLPMPMIVLDAGVASEDNIKWLRSKSYRYIVVSRKKRKQSHQVSPWWRSNEMTRVTFCSQAAFNPCQSNNYHEAQR